MKETPAQYMTRILANVEGKDPLTVLEATPRSLAQMLAAGRDDLFRRRPGPEKWSIAEIVAHLADVEMVVGYRIRLVLGSPGASIQAFDQDNWAAVEKYNDVPISLCLKAHEALRALNLRLFRSLSPQQLDQFGIHSERGQESIGRMIAHLAGHDLNHLRQIEAIVANARATA